MRRASLLLPLALAASSCASDWQRMTHGECGPAPSVPTPPPGRWDPALGCIVPAEVDRDCASRPPEQHATIAAPSDGGGIPPSECQEHASHYLSTHGYRATCACMTPAEIEADRSRP